MFSPDNQLLPHSRPYLSCWDGVFSFIQDTNGGIRTIVSSPSGIFPSGQQKLLQLAWLPPFFQRCQKILDIDPIRWIRKVVFRDNTALEQNLGPCQRLLYPAPHYFCQ